MKAINFRVTSFANFWVCLSVVFLMTASQANAALITYDFTAKVNSASGAPFGLVVNVDDLITGSFSYDTNSPVINSGSTHAVYGQSIASGFSMNVNGTIIEASTYGILIENGNAVDGFQVYAGNGTGIPGSELFVGGVAEPTAGLYWYMLDPTRSIYNDTSLPNEISVDDFSRRGFSSLFDNTPGVNNQFIWDIVSVTAVPEPSTVLLLCLGLSGLSYARRKKRIS